MKIYFRDRSRIIRLGDAGVGGGADADPDAIHFFRKNVSKNIRTSVPGKRNPPAKQ